KEQVLHRYIRRVNDNEGLLAKVKVYLGQGWNNVGRFYVLKGDLNSARESFIRSLRCNFFNASNLLCLIITFFPKIGINKLIFLKRLAWNWLRVWSKPAKGVGSLEC